MISFRVFTPAIVVLGLVLLAIMSSGCSPEHAASAAEGITVQEIASPSGGRCYVLFQGSRAIGGNCE